MNEQIFFAFDLNFLVKRHVGEVVEHSLSHFVVERLEAFHRFLTAVGYPFGHLAKYFRVGHISVAEHFVKRREELVRSHVVFTENGNHVVSHTDVSYKLHRFVAVVDYITEDIHNVRVLEAYLFEHFLKFIVIAVNI